MKNKTVSKTGTKSLLEKNWLLFLALLLSPLCCFSFSLLEFLPESLLPQSLDFLVNLFEAEVTIYNQTPERLYLTPISTTRGYPQIIRQPGRIRQRDFPLDTGENLLISYDSADMPLSGLLICRETGDCRLLKYEYEDIILKSFEELPQADQDWMDIYEQTVLFNPGIILLPISGLIPAGLFFIWLIPIKFKK